MNPFDHERLDDVIHSRIRLAIMAVLSAVDRAEFTYLRDKVNTSNGNLGMHLGKLETARYLAVQKTFVDQKPVSYYRITPHGRTALRGYFKQLESLLRPGRGG
jgi:DNA-binding MarR family transcriptional regulator